MEEWLSWARGPFFRFAILIMVLGLARHVFFTVINAWKAIRGAGDKEIPYRSIFISTLKWLLPFKNLNNRLWYSITSVLFHIGLIITPIFLGAHIVLWKRGIGIGWPVLGQAVADGLTLLTIVTGLLLIIGRVGNKFSRSISRFQDFALPLLLLIPFISGFLTMHPWLNPFSYNAAILIHVISGNVIFIIIPFTKLSHCIILPATQLVSEIGWHFPADQGENVALALHKETEPI